MQTNDSYPQYTAVAHKFSPLKHTCTLRRAKKIDRIRFLKFPHQWDHDNILLYRSLSYSNIRIVSTTLPKGDPEKRSDKNEKEK